MAKRAIRSDTLPATKILWGQILVVIMIVLVTTWSATQWTAWRLAYQVQLGLPWTHIGSVPLYPPPAFFWWWFSFDAYAPGIFVEGALIAASGGFASVAVAIAMSVWRAREAREAQTYGAARWATPKEIQAAGLLNPDGVVLGRLDRSYLRHDGPEHVLCFAPTRSGKGVGLVRLQSVARGAPRRQRGPRCAKHRRHPGRSGRRAVAAQSLGKDQPRLAGRRHSPCAVRGAGQDARRRCELSVRPHAVHRGDAAR